MFLGRIRTPEFKSVHFLASPILWAAEKSNRRKLIMVIQFVQNQKT